MDHNKLGGKCSCAIFPLAIKKPISSQIYELIGFNIISFKDIAFYLIHQRKLFGYLLALHYLPRILEDYQYET